MKEILTSPTARRGFLGRMAAFAASLSVVPSALSAETPTSTPASDPALDAWFGKIKGKHRMVFDAPEPNSGMPAIWPRVYLNSMEATYPGEAATAVVILRHAAIPLGMKDDVWAKYSMGEMFGIKDGDKAATKNPYATITTLPLPGLGIAELLKSGALVGLCDVALTVYSSGAAQKMGLDAAAVKKEWVASLMPGVQVVPSGVFGVGRAQELGCGYCFAG